MGVLTDFVVADVADAERVGEAHVPSREFDGIDAKGIDQILMAELYATLTGSELDSDFLQNEESFLYKGPEETRWVQLVPADLVERIAKLSEFEINRVGRDWFAASKEFRYTGWTSVGATGFLREFQLLCKRAVAEKKSVLMWTCL